jgi:5-enolpyruvylshikimate-3-phosphate synthase
VIRLPFTRGGLKSLGVNITEAGGHIICEGKRLKGGDVHLDYPSVGATENLMMTAALAPGTTMIRNAAREPEIVELQSVINEMGGSVKVAKLNIDQNPRTSQRLGITAIPALKLYRNGQLVDAMTGAAPKNQLLLFLQPHLR